MEDHNDVSSTDSLSLIQEQLVDVKTDLDKAIKTKKNFAIIFAILAGVLAAHYAGELNINVWLLVPVWIFAILFLIAAIGTDTKDHEKTLEKIKYRKELLSGLVQSSQKATHFDSLVNINLARVGRNN